MSEHEETLQVTVGSFTFRFNRSEIDKMDASRISANQYHVVNRHRSVSGQVVEASNDGKKLRVEIEGLNFPVTIRDRLDQMLDQMGYSNVSTRQIKEIRAPMPGLVINVAVNEGQEVREGDRILILEAMKMENSILIHADGKIKKISVKPGQAVDKGQVLIELE